MAALLLGFTRRGHHRATRGRWLGHTVALASHRLALTMAASLLLAFVVMACLDGIQLVSWLDGMVFVPLVLRPGLPLPTAPNKRHLGDQRRRPGASRATAAQVDLLAADFVPEESVADGRLQARQALLQAVMPLDRGFSATSEDRTQVKMKIDALVQLNPTPEPTARLGGEWTLIYTDAPDIIGIPQTTGPLASLGRIGQEIDSVAGTIANVIEYKPSPLVASLVSAASSDTFVQRVFTDYLVTSPTGVDLNIRGLGLAPQKLLGFQLPEVLQLKIKGPLALPFGHFEILYLDEQIRIIQTAQGWCSVNRRKEFAA
ncbi:unnamed protein product [Polarella glacialis]|uniref:Plastid lipid-associated protein/fibrillin conserved domain-containing protein n=1 Tax=Polarella glacialis TaxID=89957 RepID=A0A813FBJ0_POLGL|nr:unnamed protein product [Polarella glacialis]